MTQLRRFSWYALFVVMFLLPGKSAAQSGTVTDDAFVSNNSVTQLANLNGQGIALVVSGSSGTVGPVQVGATKTFLKFQLQSSLPPNVAAANVAKATLKLFISPSCSPTGAIDIYPITSAWTESTLNPSSPPSESAIAFATGIPVGKANSFWVVDVTQLVKDWLEGSANGGLDNDGIALVADTSSTSVIFDSKENIVTSHEPRLEIVLVDGGPPGPVGPAGPAGALGATGPAGAPGLTATIAIGSVNPVASNAAPAVMNTGTPTNAVFNFLIPQGQPGTIGPQGPTGAQGPVGINNRGQWSAANAYNPNDAVSDQGSFWLALQSIPGNTPNSEPSAANASWQLLAAQGVQGPQGQPGAPGSQGPQGATGPQGPVGLQGPVGSQGPAGPQGPAGIGSAGASSSLLSAFLPGPLTQAYTAASFVPDTPITVTHILAALKTPPDAACAPTVLRVTDGSTGQDVRLLAGQGTQDTGPLTLPFGTGTALQVKVQTPAACRVTNPADANLVVEYRGQLSGDQQTCAQSGLACNGICEETQSDPNNCGACGNVCPLTVSPFCIANPNQCSAAQQSCISGVCGGCSSGLTACNSTCTNVQSDPGNCGACGTACLAGQACTAGQCMGNSPNGAVCNSANQCTGGFCTNGVCSNCSFVHSNGAGQSYTDCANPLGTPGNAATYNLTMAQEAARAFSPNGTPTSLSCNGAAAISVVGNGLITVGVWVYEGPLAGSMGISPLVACPTQLSSTWN